MRKLWKITWHVLLAIVLVVYVVVAAVNYSVVQSYLGTLAGNYFAGQWGGVVRVGSLHATPWDHVIMDNVLIVAPDGDTVVCAEHIALRMKRFPYATGNTKQGGKNIGTLQFSRVYLKNTYYHLAVEQNDSLGRPEINLKHIINYYTHGVIKHQHTGKTFTVDVGTLVLDNVHYKMDLVDHRRVVYDHGVEIPHMEFSNLNGRFKDIHVVNEDVTARVLKLSATERSGFVVENIAGEVHVGKNDITATNMVVETPTSRILVDAQLQYHNWMRNYLHTVHHQAVIKPGTTVDMADVAYWAPVLWGVKAHLQAQGTAHGTIDSLCTDGLHVQYSPTASATVVGSVVGLPHIEQTVFDIEQLALSVDQADLSALQHDVPMLPNAATKYLREVQYVDLHGTAHGSIAATASMGIDIASGIGNLRADATTRKLGNGYRHVAAEANSDGLGLSVLGSDWLSHTGLSLGVDATLPPHLGNLQAIDAQADLTLHGSTVRGNHLQPISAQLNLNQGVAHLQAHSTDSLLHCTIAATANLADSLRSYFADVDAQHINAHALRLAGTQLSTIKGHIIAAATGNTPDNLNIKATATGLQIGNAQIGSMSITADAAGGYKSIDLESQPLKASATGHFAYTDLPIMLHHIMASAVPADLGLASPTDSTQLQALQNSNMQFNLLWNDNGRLLHTLVPNISIAQGTRIVGTSSGSELPRVVLRSDSARIGKLRIDGIGIDCHPLGNSYVASIETQELSAANTTIATNINITANSNTQRALLGIEWGAPNQTTQGDVMLRLQQGRVGVVRPNFSIGGTPWQISIDSLIVHTPQGYLIDGHNVCLSSKSQRISSTLSIKRQQNDNIGLDFSRFNISSIAHLLLAESQYTVNGLVDGHFELYGIGQTPYFNANLNVDSCRFNSQELGNIAVRSNWNAELNTLNLQLGNPHMAAQGWIGLDTVHELNLNVLFDSLDLGLAAPAMSAFTSRFGGLLHGSLDIGGTLHSPAVVGEALVENGVLLVDMTGVPYYFTDSITFTGNTVHLNHFKLIDPRGNIAYIDGNIRLNSLHEVVLDLGLNTSNLLVLNKAYGEQYYGTVLASATGSVRGRTDALNISVAARTNAGSTLTVPVSDQRTIRQQGYITFVGADDYAPTKPVAQKNSNAPNIDVSLSITPDVRLNLPMNFSGVSVNVGAIGSGDLHLDMPRTEQPQIMGNYEIASGTMKMNVMSVMSKDFTIESGSSLNFQGSAPDALFDIRAVYSQRVNLSTLTGSLSAVDNTQKYIQVENVIAVSGTLREPSIEFDIRLPSADQSVEDEVFAYIDRSSELDMLNQTISLLMSGRFYNVSGNDQGNATSNATASGISTIASALGSRIADMVDVVDINVDYRAATEATNEQLDFNISKDWGRWYLESTLGYGGESRELEASTYGGTVVDALLGYRISPLVHLFAYNRTNTNDYTRMDLPYKQGIGLKLTKDFNRWGELFGIKGNKRNKHK